MIFKKIKKSQTPSYPIAFFNYGSLQSMINREAKLGTKLEWIWNAAKVIMGPLPAIIFHKESQLKT